MASDYSNDLDSLRKRLTEAEDYLKISELKVRQPELADLAAQPGLWDDQENARRITGELSAATEDLETFETLGNGIEDIEALMELAAEEDDPSLGEEIEATVSKLSNKFEGLELRALFAGEFDERDAVCQVQAGEGGTDAQDWAEMLVRMYMRWAEKRGFAVEVMSAHEGTEAGLSSAEFMVKGRHAFGLMRSEHGVHRLVRISPFNKEGKRQTAFASLQIVPFFEEVSDEIQIDETELRIDTYRSSGAGGQHINVTDSAVRITHLPTGMVTSCQNERSQHQNKDRAMQMMASKLLDLERQKRKDEIAEIAGEAKNVGFGSQIRSYVLQPYQMVKDLRSEYESGNVDGVLGGEIEDFMTAYLQWERAQS